MKISAMGKMKNMPPADMDPQVVNMPPSREYNVTLSDYTKIIEIIT